MRADRRKKCPPTGSQRPTSLWLILVKPVVKMLPSLVKMALMGLMPSCGAILSCNDKNLSIKTRDQAGGLF